MAISSLAWKNYLRSRSEEEERKRREAEERKRGRSENANKADPVRGGLDRKATQGILRSATEGAAAAVPSSSQEFQSYRDALNRANVATVRRLHSDNAAQTLAKRTAQQVAAQQLVKKSKAPTAQSIPTPNTAQGQVPAQVLPANLSQLPQFNYDRAPTFNEQVRRTAQNWVLNKKDVEARKSVLDTSTIEKRKQGYEDQAEKAASYLTGLASEIPGLVDTYQNRDTGEWDIDKLYEKHLSRKEFRESIGWDESVWPKVDEAYSKYAENKARSADADRDLRWANVYEAPEELISAAKNSDDYEDTVGQYRGNTGYQEYIDAHGFGPDSDPEAVQGYAFMSRLDNYNTQTLGETADNDDTVAGMYMSTARDVMDEATEDAREKFRQAYPNSNFGLDKMTLEDMIHLARNMHDGELQSAIQEIKDAADERSKYLHDGTDERLNYTTQDERDGLKYWLVKAEQTGDWSNFTTLMNAVKGKADLRYYEAQREEWAHYAKNYKGKAWFNDRMNQLKSGFMAPFAAAAAENMGDRAMFSEWFEPTARNQVQEGVIKKSVYDWANNSSVGASFNNGIGKTLGINAGDVANFFYDGVSSFADQTFRDLPAVMGVPGWQAFSLFVMGSSAFTDTLFNDLMAGRDKDSSLKHALFVGSKETLTELIGADAATRWVDGSTFLSYLGKTIPPEMMEEYIGAQAENIYNRSVNDYHDEARQGALARLESGEVGTYAAGLEAERRQEDINPWIAAAGAILPTALSSGMGYGAHRSMYTGAKLDEAQDAIRQNVAEISEIQPLEAEYSGLTEEERELLAEQERRRSGSLEDRKAAMTEIMEQEAQGQQTEEPETAVPGPQVDIAERKAANIEEGQREERPTAPRRTAEQVQAANEEDTTQQYPEREAKETAPGPQQAVDQRRAANVEEGQKEPTPPAPRRSPEQMREGNVEETTSQTPPAQQAEKQTPPGPQKKIDERKQANVEDGKKPKQKKSELAAMRERIAGMSDDAITARLGEIAERRASLEAELARRKDVVNKRGKTIEKLIKTATGEKVKAATAEELLGETKQDSSVSTGDLGDGKTIKGLDKDGNIIASDGSTISAKNVDWDAMPATKEVYDTAMELSEDYNVAPGVVFAAYADGMRASVFRSGARAIVSAARAGTSLQNVLSNHRAAAALDPRMVQAMYDQAAEKGIQFARERTEAAAKLKPLESGEGNVSMTPEAAEFLKGLKPDNTILQSVQVINDLFGKAGPKIEFFLAGEGAEQGAINKAADTIRIALDAGDKGGMVQSAILQVLPHELTHMIATRYVEGYLQLQKYVSDYLTSQGKSLDDYVEDIKADYARDNVQLTTDKAMEEAVAKASELVIPSSKFAERVANNNPSLANRIVDWLRSMKARIASIFKNYKPLSTIARDMQDAMDGYVKIWDDALENALNIKREQAQDIEAVKGDEGTAYTASNEEIGFHYELVDAFDLTASNDYETMLENPLYPSELQPRDRSRQTSEDQIDSIVRELNPNRLMGSSEVSTGAPIVGPDYIVESGNGRTIALQRVMKQGGKNAQKYTEALRQRAAEYGFKPENVKDGQVLVRVRDSAMNNAQRAEFAKASNVSATMTSAAAETAASDAQKLSNKALGLYNPDGDVQSNADFFYRFLNEAIPASDRNSMLTRTGQPSQALIARAKAAMFYRAYGNNDLTAHMSEQADPEAKNAVSAMMGVAARVASIADQIQGGTLHDINFAADIANAAAQFIELKRTGQDVNDWLNQQSMFEQDDTVRAIVGLMEKHKRSAVKLTGAFNFILDQVEAAGNPEQESLFGDDALPTKQEIVERAGEEDGTRFSLRGESELSDREVLGEALPEIARTNGERLYLGKYQEAYNKLKGNQRDLRDQQDIMDENARYSNSQERIDDAEVESDRKKRNARYNEARNRAEIYQRRITEAEEALDSLEQDSRFQDLVKREIARAEASVNRDFENQNTYEQDYAKTIRGYEKRLYNRKRALQQYREDRNTSADRRRYIDRITDTVKDLSEMLAAKTDKKHVNAALEKPLGDFLNALNLYSKRYNAGGDETQKDLKLSQYLRRVQDAVRKSENINEAGDYTGELYLPQGFVDQIADLTQTIENLERKYADADPVVHMSNDSLKKLDLALRALKKSIGDINKLYTNAAYQKVSEMGRASIHYLNGFTPMSKRNGKFKRYLNWDMATPVYAMDRFGKVGQSLFKAIRDGYGQRAQRLNEIEEYASKHWTAKEAKSWKEDIKTFTFDRVTDDGKHNPIEMKLTVSQIMELYLAAKRDQAVKHIEAGGIRARTITEGSKTLINQPEAAHLSLDEIKEITGSLTDRQREVCDAMSKYMKTTSAWGNEVSMRRFGYNAFGEPNYWPISTDEFSRDGVPEQGQVQGSNLYRLLNMTFTKALNPHANNALLLNGAFETFAAHTTDMATYSTMALPALDMIKWYNFREKLDDGTLISTRGSMSRTYGDEAAKYIRNLISDFSGSTRTVERGTENQIYSKLMSHAKRAAVAGNLSVVLKQPGSILRAGYVLPRAMYLRPSALISRHDYNEMLEHSGIARWKSMGYFDTNLAKPMEAKIAGDETGSDKFVEFMTKGAEWADKNTMVSIWKAAKAQVAHDNKGMDRSGKEYFQKVTDLFEDIIYRTQVVDSTLTRSQSMRNPGFLGKSINAFMAEPTLSYNVMMDALTDVVEDHRQGRKGISKAAGKKIAVASTTYVMTQVIQALVGAMMSAWRDDDDYKTFMEKFWARAGSSILDELNPINSIPLVSFLLDSLNGDNSSVADSGLVQLRYAYNGFKKVLWKDGKFNENWQEDMANDWQKLTRYSLSAASYLSGLPGMNVCREVWNVWNNTMDLTGNQELKFHPYSSSDSNKARAAMYYDAIRRGDQAAIDRLEKIMEINGFTGDKFRDAFNDVVKEDFLGGGISQEEAEKILIKYNGYDEAGSKSAYHFLTGAAYKYATGAESYSMYIPLQTALLKGDAEGIKAAQWELVDHYGIKEKDIPGKTGESIRDMYKDGKITRAEAESLLRTYTDDTALEIDKALDKAQFKGENPDFDMDDWSYYQGIFDLIDQGKDIKAEVRANYSYSTADQINSAVKTYIKKSYQEGRISASQLEQKLKQYATYSDAYGAYWAAQEIAYETANPGKDYHYIDSLIAAMDRGAGVQSEITRMLSHGKTGEGISTQLTSHYKPLWKAGNANTRAAIQQKMVAAWQALGYTNKQIQTKLKNLQKNWAK